MVRKPNSMYRQIKGPAYTRREYMGGVPASRITQFDLGNKGGEFPVELSLVAKESCHVRHTALEAARITANRTISKKAGVMGYHLKVRTYPHHVLRENKQATGAGADRISQGMRNSFGKLVGTAARVSSGQKIITIRTNKQHFLTAKDALRKAGMKLPTPISIVIDKGEELVS
ncbi:MAG: 50S ribosomal protein L16 [Thermoplasmata archaeon]|nr:50S ribosomal protein L16 [Thermoplasmata archaeon]